MKPNKLKVSGAERPPAYPQVVTIQELERTVVHCRFCHKTIDDWIFDNITAEEVRAIKPGYPFKVAHMCGNIIKIIKGAN